MSGANQVQRNSNIVSQKIPGGSKIGAWFTSSDSTVAATFGRTRTSVPNTVGYKVITYATTMPNSDSIGFTVGGTFGFYVKAYYKGCL